MTSAARVVLDTNVVLSALVFASGRLTPIRALWQEGRVIPLVSTATAQELIRALGYAKFKLTPEDQEELLADYLPYCTSVRIPAKAPRTPGVRDPLDVPFLQLAAAGKAMFLVTGDKDLLSVRGPIAYSIVTAAVLLESL